MSGTIKESDRTFALDAAALASELVMLVDEMEADLEVRRALSVEFAHRLFRLRVKAERLLSGGRKS